MGRQFAYALALQLTDIVRTQRPAGSRGLSPALWKRNAAMLLPLALLWCILCRSLSLEWSGNEQYSYGWFVPFFAAYLFWLRWENRPPPTRAPARDRAHNRFFFILVCSALLFLLPIRAFEVAAPDWRPVGWLHAAVVVGLTLLVLWRVGGKAWAWHFTFPVAFILVAVPWLPGIETMVVQRLMRTVAAIVAETFSLFGIPAQLEGNLLRLSTGLVGVSEACSGVRSLQTSLMIGLLFGELNRLNLLRRLNLVVAAAAIALLGNVCRASFLVWIAVNRGIDATEQWHDVTGYSIVGIVFFGTMTAASMLGRHKAEPREASPKAEITESDARCKSPPARPRAAPLFIVSTSAAAMTLAWLLTIEVAVEGWYRYHERDLVQRQGWTVRWPESAWKFRYLKLDDRMSGLLRFDEGRGASWLLQDAAARREVNSVAPVAAASAPPLTCVVYFFRWDASRSSILRARGHRPDVCLPSVGWAQRADHGTRTYSAGDLPLPFRHFEFAGGGGAPPSAQIAHAFFCVGEDLMRAGAARSETVSEITEMHGLTLIPHLWRLVRSGERPHGQQVMQVVIVSARQMPTADAESRFAKLLRDLIVTEPEAMREGEP